MRRLPIALVLAAAIVLMVTVNIHYTPPQTNKTISAYVAGSDTSWTLYIYYNASLPPPIIIINTNPPTEIASYPPIVYSNLGAVYVATGFNGSAITYTLSRLPINAGVRDYITINITMAGATSFYISTDNSTAIVATSAPLM